MLVDTHCHLNHLDLSSYQGDLTQALHAAANHDVGYFLNVCIDLAGVPNVIALAEQHANIFASVGLHPNEKISHEPTATDLVTLAIQSKKIIAIGETGLDYFRSEGDLEWQRQRFREHIRAAKITRRPLIVHSRDAQKDTIAILKDEAAEEIGGVMHCFTEDWTMAKQALDLNFYISFSGIITFKNAVQINEVAKQVPMDRILIETDSPYLAPVPFRGKPNEPAYVRYVAEHIAKLKNIQYDIFAKQTTENFFKLFGLEN